MARLCSQIREETHTCLDLADYITPEYFNDVVKAAKVLSLASPQLCIALGHYLRHLVLLKLSKAITVKDSVQRNSADDFKLLMEARWNTQVTTVTRRRQKLVKMNKADEIPETEDLVKFSEYLKCQLKNEINSTEIAKLCMTQLILFNKRRPFEVAELTKDDFRTITDTAAANKEVLDSLTETEKMLAKR